MIERDSLFHLLSYLCQINATSCCVPVKQTLHGHWESPLSAVSLPLSSPATLQPFFSLFLLDDREQSTTFGAKEQQITDSKNPFDWVLIRYCKTSRNDNIHTWEQGRNLLCIFSPSSPLVCNQLYGAKTRTFQSGITCSSHHYGELPFCGRQSGQNTCGSAGSNGIVNSSIS